MRASHVDADRSSSPHIAIILHVGLLFGPYVSRPRPRLRQELSRPRPRPRSRH